MYCKHRTIGNSFHYEICHAFVCGCQRPCVFALFRFRRRLCDMWGWGTTFLGFKLGWVLRFGTCVLWQFSSRLHAKNRLAAGVYVISSVAARGGYYVSQGWVLRFSQKCHVRKVVPHPVSYFQSLPVGVTHKQCPTCKVFLPLSERRYIIDYQGSTNFDHPNTDILFRHTWRDAI